MIVVDSSAWIEWLANSVPAERIAEHLPKKAEWLLPRIVKHELAKWLRRENVEDGPIMRSLSLGDARRFE